MKSQMFSPIHWPNLKLAAITTALAVGMLAASGCASSTDVREKTRVVEAPSSTEHAQVIQTAQAESAPPLPDVTQEPDEKPLLRLAIISDMNGRYGSADYDAEVVKSIDMIIEDRPDIVINAGDMVAGQKAKLKYRKMWAGFHATVTDRLKEAGILMAQVAGNHDGSAYKKYANERAIYIDEWNQRKPELEYVDDTFYPLHYSFQKNNLFFIGLDASTLDALSEEQFLWLENQLRNNPSPYPPIVFMHVPLFPITTIKPTEILRDNRMAETFSKYGVQLVISGHQQAYFPAALNGVMYLHAGALGGGPRPVRQNNGVAPKTLTFVNIYANHPPYIDTHIINGEKGEHFNHNLLPTYIVFGNNILPRVDVSLEDAKFARDYMISPHMTKSQMLTLIDALRANGGDWGKIPEWQ